MSIAPLIPEPDLTEEIASVLTIIEGTAGRTGDEFFRALVQHLSQALHIRYAFIAEFAEVQTRVSTLAYWFRDRIVPNVEFDLEGTPSQEVVKGNLCHHPRGAKELLLRRAEPRKGPGERQWIVSDF